MLHGLKEAPVYGMTSPLPVRPLKITGTQNPLRLRLKYIHRTASSTSLNGNSLHRLNGFSLPKISRLTHTLLIISALYMSGCGLHCRQALLPRDRQPAPDC